MFFSCIVLFMTFEVLGAVTVNITVSWDMIPISMVGMSSKMGLVDSSKKLVNVYQTT